MSNARVPFPGKEYAIIATVHSRQEGAELRQVLHHEGADETNGGSRKRLCTEMGNEKNRIEPAAHPHPERAPFGRFVKGNEIFRNRIATTSEETNADGHYAIEELLLPGCISAMCTTFETPSREWAHEIFGEIPDLLIVRPPSTVGEATKPGPVVGEALLSPICPRQHRNWFWIFARPHTGGCLHSKLLLFRSNQGLRVVVLGCNLSERQWKSDRDVFWAQDFPCSSVLLNEDKKYSAFEVKLTFFLKDITKCASRAQQSVVNSRLENIFDGIDFSAASASLVVSFPRRQETGEDSGGWKSLAAAVKESLANLYDSDDDSSVESAEDESDYVLHANSGSVGDLQPDFVRQMCQAMNGKDDPVSRKSSWSQVEDQFRWLWPSTKTASSMNPISLLGTLRGIPKYHYPSIPLSTKEKVFHDAPPNPPNKAKMPGMGNQEEYHAVTHGKFMYNRRGIIYVGSHNFSKAAWGLHEKQPQNVEVGVVLVSSCPTTNLQWNNRLPCQLPSESRAPRTYIPFSLPGEVYVACRMANDIPKAVMLLKQWFVENSAHWANQDQSDDDSDED